MTDLLISVMAKHTYTVRNQFLYSSMAKPNKREQQETQVQNYAGRQKTQWDFQNKGESGWTGKMFLCFGSPTALFASQHNLLGTCERIMPRAHSLLVSINMKTMMSHRSQEYNQQSDSFVLYKKLT